jgi:hypothetical protein
MAHDNQAWFSSAERYEPFLRAVIHVWDELRAVGPRYYWATQGEDLWSIPNNLHFVLANMGVPHDRLRAPLPADGLGAMVKHASRGRTRQTSAY